MKIVDGALYMEFTDFIAAGWSAEAVKKANLRNGQYWMMVDDPADRRKPLVRYDTLRPEHKAKLNAHYGGCVHAHHARQPLLALLKPNDEARRWYRDYRYTNALGQPMQLTEAQVAESTARAEYMDMLTAVMANKKLMRAAGIREVDVFVTHFIALCQAAGVDLPDTYQVLLRKRRSYAAMGYSTLLPARLGNGNSAKVANEACEQQLLRLIEHPNQYDDVLVCMMYNEWAKAQGHKAITPAAVGDWRRKREPEIMMGRQGNAAFGEKYIRQVKGEKLVNPLELVECDDYNLNYYYTDPAAPAGSRHYKRYVSYIVADSATKLVLGKAYGPGSSPSLLMVQMAWIDAMYYLRELTGGWHLPLEVKADGWQKGTLWPWFRRIAKFVPPAHANKHRGYIEPLFGSDHYKRAEALAAHDSQNYNGHNITARHRGVNLEALKLGEKHRPLVGAEADEQVERHFGLLQRMPYATRKALTGPSLEDTFKARWAALPASQKRPCTDEEFLLLFGLRHAHANTITNRGVEPQIGGVRYSYDLPDYVGNMGLIGRQVQILYDPYDMSRVLLTDYDRIRLVATSAALVPRTMEAQRPGSRELLNSILAEKQAQTAAAGGKAEARRLAAAGMADPAMALLAHTLPKADKNRVELAWEQQALGSGGVADDDENEAGPSYFNLYSQI